MDIDSLAQALFGGRRAEEQEVETNATTRTYMGVAVSDSSDGTVRVDLGGDVTLPDDLYDEDGNVVAEWDGAGIEMSTSPQVREGQDVIVTLVGGTSTKRPMVTAVAGEGDHQNERIGAIEADYMKATTLEADVAEIGFLKADSATIADLQADTAKVHDLTAAQLTAATGYVGELQAGSVSAQDIVAGKATVGQLAADHVSVSDLDAATARIGDLEADHVSVADFQAEQANIDTLQANTADIDTIRANSAKVQNLTAAQLEADHATIGTLDTTYATIGNLNAANGRIDTLESTKANISDLEANYITADVIDATYMHANMSNSDVAWIENGTIKDGAIVSAMINDVSANKLTAGTINGSVINVTNLNADNITTGTINGQRIGTGSLSLDKLADDVYTETEVNNIVDGLNDRIDGAIETHTGTAVPTLNNSPASSWNTTKLRDEHVGDVYYVVNSQSQQNGYCYRFTKSGSTYSWQLIKDSDVTAALQRISAAEGKITTFDSDISTLKTDTGTLTTRTTNLETRADDVDATLLDKVDVTTFNEVSDTVDAHTQTISQHTTAISNKADSSTVTAVTNRVSKNEQDISGINTTIGELQDTVETKADGSTVSTISNKLNTVSDTVDGHTQAISSVQSTLSTKADSSTVSTLTTKVNTVSDTVDGHTQRLSSVEDTLETKADGSTVSTISTKVNNISDTVDGHTSQLQSVTSTQTSMQSTLDKTVKSSIQLWYSKANTTAPSKPTSQVTSTSTAGNAWRIVVPAYNASYPNYYYCWQYEYVDGTYGWSAVVRDIAMGESQATARTADSNASAAVTTANTASTNASTALTTANTASTNASEAKTAATMASTTASEAKTTAETAASDASTAKTNAASAVTTANSASTTATNAQNTANANIKSSVQLWFTKANSTAPNKPTAVVSTSNANTANAWNLVVPVWNSSYPHYYYCYQQQKGDGTYQWTDVVYDRATSEAQQLANTTSTNLSTLQTNYATFKQTTEQFETTVGSRLTTIESDIDGVEERVSDNETSISNNASAIALKANSSDVYTKTAVDSKITQEVTDRNSAIEQSASAINLSVSQNYTTKTEFNNLEIGGRNLLYKRVSAGGRVTANGDYSIILNASENLDTYFTLYTRSQLVEGTTYVISCEASGINGEGVYYKFPLFRQGSTIRSLDIDKNGINSFSFVMNATELGYHTARTVDDLTVYAVLMDDVDRNIEGQTGPITLTNFKLEKGNKPTDWTPAPEDMVSQTEFAEAKSEIKQTTDGITSTVSKISGIKYLQSVSAGWPLSNIKTYAAEGVVARWGVVSSDNVRVGDAILIKGYDTTRQCNVYVKGTVNSISGNYLSITAHGYEDVLPSDVVISSINQSAESVTIDANKINLIGAVTIGDLASATQDAVLNSNVLVGGRNLLRWTASPVANQTTVSTSTSPSETNGWYMWNAANMTLARNGTGDGVRFAHDSSTTGQRGIVIPLAHDDAVVGGEEYTLSFTYKTNLTALGTIYLLGPNGNVAYGSSVPITASESDWARFSAQVKWPSTSGKVMRYLLIPYRNAASCWMEIQDGTLKLERGNKATDWSPAPEDVDADISEAAQTASNYITTIDTTNGIKIANASPSSATTYLQLASNFLDFIRGGTSMLKAWLDGSVAKVRVGAESGFNTLTDDEGIKLREGTDIAAQFTKNVITLCGGAGRISAGGGGAISIIGTQPKLIGKTSDDTSTAMFSVGTYNGTNYADIGAWTDDSNVGIQLYPVIDGIYSVPTISIESDGSDVDFAITDLINAIPVTLYNNNSASASAATTLSESAANFRRLTIMYRDQDNTYGSVDVWEPNGKRVALDLTWINGASTQQMYQRVRWVTISGTTISTAKDSGDSKYRTGQVRLGGSYSVTNSDYISIVHVIGYR